MIVHRCPAGPRGRRLPVQRPAYRRPTRDHGRALVVKAKLVDHVLDEPDAEFFDALERRVLDWLFTPADWEIGPTELVEPVDPGSIP